MTRIAHLWHDFRFAAAAAALALVAFAPGCEPPDPYPAKVLPSGCILIADQPEQAPPAGWRYWIVDDGDPRGYWTNTEPAHSAPRLGYSEGRGADIYDSTSCSLSGGQVVTSRP